jgi:DNA-binding transcriptional LysR family regulator
VFQQVVEEGGFAAAARKMGLATAVVSRLVSDLEHHLGVRLLQRTTRSLSLTQAGETYLERLRGILGEIEAAEAMVQDQDRDMSGTVRVLAPPVVAVHMLAQAVVGFQRAHPHVKVDVQVEDSPDPAVHEYDLAVLSGVANIDPASSSAPSCSASRSSAPRRPTWRSTANRPRRATWRSTGCCGCGCRGCAPARCNCWTRRTRTACWSWRSPRC